MLEPRQSQVYQLKPIIDIDIIVQNQQENLAVIKTLAKLGYEHLGDMGIEGRKA